MNVARLLDRTAHVFPERPAVLLGTEVLSTYAGFGRAARALGAALAGRGLVPGDRVALVMRNCPEYLVALFGAWYAGLVVVPVNAKLHPKEVAFIVSDSGAGLVLATDDWIDLLPIGCPALSVSAAAFRDMAAGQGPAPVHRAPDDTAWLFYTSGTTGRPKGVMQTHRNLLAMTLAYFVDVDPVASEDVSIYAAPMSHGAGMYCLPHVVAGARHMIPRSGGFDPAELFDLARSAGPASLFAAPTMVKRLVDHAESAGLEGAGFKTIVYGGGPMYAADIERAMRVMGPCFAQIYGQGESPMTITALSRHHLLDAGHPRHAARIASVGVAHSVVEVRIADPDGRTQPVGGVGEVLVRGETVMKGYWNNPGATAETIRDGWLFTGDLGSLDEDGFLTLKDRSKDLIISGGTNIYPREVEEVLLRHSAVAEVAVVGVPHEEWGEEVVAFVVPRGEAPDTGDLDALCLANLARFKRPKRYRFVETLPKNNYGKILKRELRDRIRGLENG